MERIKNGAVERNVEILTLQQAFDRGADKSRNESIHELIKQPYHKIFFDVDSKPSKPIAVQEFLNHLHGVLVGLGIYERYSVYSATCHRPEKISYHIVLDLVVHRHVMKIIGK